MPACRSYRAALRRSLWRRSVTPCRDRRWTLRRSHERERMPCAIAAVVLALKPQTVSQWVLFMIQIYVGAAERHSSSGGKRCRNIPTDDAGSAEA